MTHLQWINSPKPSWVLTTACISKTWISTKKPFWNSLVRNQDRNLAHKISNPWRFKILIYISFLFFGLYAGTRGVISQGISCGYIGKCTIEACEKICEKAVGLGRCVSATNCCCLGAQQFPMKWLDHTHFFKLQKHQWNSFLPSQ